MIKFLGTDQSMLNDIHAGLKTITRFKISNKSFIHSPGKEKAKTSKIEFWPYQQIRGDISVPGTIDKT